MFVDRVKIKVRAGRGGNGVVSFRREKYIPKGGPNGGDGGKGGDIIIEANDKIGTLIDLYNHPHQSAKNGESGQGSNKKGKNGEDLFIKVPLGTLVEDMDSSTILSDLTENGQRIIVAQGGQGGKGNFRFKSSIRRSPRFAQKGEPGEEKKLYLSLKIIADVGLVGYPNAGKSTLLSRISAAKPKIADYPFTTLSPNLGVVSVDEAKSFMVADIPGLIEGAHQGTGLGDEFLKHIERTKIILHIIDGSLIKKEDPLYSFRAINKELNSFSEKLTKKPQLIAINKCDLLSVKENMSYFKDAFHKEGYQIFPISALTGEGLNKLIYSLSSLLDELKLKEKETITEVLPKKGTVYKFAPRFVINKKGDLYEVTGAEIERIVAMTNFDNEEAIDYFQKIIKKMGLEKDLIKKGIKEGDQVKIKEIIFTFSNK
ncbi:MAG: GTPase ObgE [Chloroflexi bacterium]|nr:GTPase ObgE [Chloroflexota bacterium]MBE3127529.1 GTPase ObgE [Candidatus Atribacteria bacterium]